MADTHPLILSLRSAGLRDVDTCNLDEVHNMWAAFSRAKNCIDGGDRLEYLSWRIYSREILARKPQSVGNQLHAEPGSPPPSKEILPSDAEAEGSDSDYESCSDDSEVEAADLSRKKLPPQQRDVREAKGPPPKEIPSTVPQLVSSKSNNTTQHPHRRISSIELQHLFKDAHSLDPKYLKKCASRSDQEQKAPVRGTSKDESRMDSSLALNAYQNRFGTAVQKAPPKDKEVTPPKSSSSLLTSLPDEGASTAVRGFSPSSVSVSVSMNRGLAPKPESVTETATKDTKSDGKIVTWKKASLPREKIFFIEAESDSDVSDSAGSVENDRSNPRSSKTVSKHVEITEDDNRVAKYENDDDEDNEAYGSSGWDDTSGEENSDDDGDNEEDRTKNLFKERAVPSQPLLKRSLLSSLFVKDMKENTPSPNVDNTGDGGSREGTPYTQSSGSPQDHQGVAAPVDILLGAAVAPHIPLPVASPRTVRRDMLDTELSQSLRENMRQSRNYDVDLMFRTRPSNSRSFSESAADTSVSESSTSTTPGISSLHMTARPEMYRASTDNGVSYRRPSEERGSWQSHHEDIYDPMNYHSRGW